MGGKSPDWFFFPIDSWQFQLFGEISQVFLLKAPSLQDSPKSDILEMISWRLKMSVPDY